MFGVTCTPIAKMLEAVKEATSLFNYHPRFDLWGKNYVRENPSGSAPPYTWKLFHSIAGQWDQ